MKYDFLVVCHQSIGVSECHIHTYKCCIQNFPQQEIDAWNTYIDVTKRNDTLPAVW